MKRSFFILLLGALSLTGAASAQAQEITWTSLDFVSHYSDRGYRVVDGPSLQPAIGMSWFGERLALEAWGSAALIDRPAFRIADELDLTLSYAPGPLGLSLGVGVYVYPNQKTFSLRWHSTPEFFAGLAPALPLRPQAALYYDPHLGNGSYIALGIGHELERRRHTLTASATLGYNGGQYGAEPGWSHLDLALTDAWTFGAFTFAPRLVYVRSFASTGEAGNLLVFGLQLGR